MVSVLARPPVRLTYRVVRIAVETAGFNRGVIYCFEMNEFARSCVFLVKSICSIDGNQLERLGVYDVVLLSEVRNCRFVGYVRGREKVCRSFYLPIPSFVSREKKTKSDSGKRYKVNLIVRNKKGMLRSLNARKASLDASEQKRKRDKCRLKEIKNDIKKAKDLECINATQAKRSVH